MKFDFKIVTEGQLAVLIARAKQRRTELKNEAIARVRKKIQTMIESEGLTLNEVLGGLQKTRCIVGGISVEKFRKQ